MLLGPLCRHCLQSLITVFVPVTCAEMLAVEELWEGAARGTDRPVIIFNGALSKEAAAA